MGRTLGGILTASIVLYVWGFLYWGMGPYGTMIWKQATDRAAAGEALKTYFPENGVYMVPAVVDGDTKVEMEPLDADFRAGPVAMVLMTAVDGRPAFEPSIMMNGFFVNLAFIVVVAILMRLVGSAMLTYVSRVRFAFVAGLACAVLTSAGDIAWWQFDVAWMLYGGVYYVTAWLIVGLVLGCPCFEMAKPEVVPLDGD